MPAHQAVAMAALLPIGVPRRRPRTVSMIGVKGWYSANQRSAVGIEANSDRAARAARNAAALGVPELQIVQGQAPAALAGLARPDAVFIGGGMMADGVFDAAWSALKPGGRLVANAVSLETEARLTDYFGTFGGDLIRLQIARADKIGAVAGWRPAMPVTQWRVRKP